MHADEMLSLQSLYRSVSWQPTSRDKRDGFTTKHRNSSWKKSVNYAKHSSFTSSADRFLQCRYRQTDLFTDLSDFIFNEDRKVFHKHKNISFSWQREHTVLLISEGFAWMNLHKFEIVFGLCNFVDFLKGLCLQAFEEFTLKSLRAVCGAGVLEAGGKGGKGPKKVCAQRTIFRAFHSLGAGIQWHLLCSTLFGEGLRFQSVMPKGWIVPNESDSVRLVEFWASLNCSPRSDKSNSPLSVLRQIHVSENLGIIPPTEPLELLLCRW